MLFWPIKFAPLHFLGGVDFTSFNFFWMQNILEMILCLFRNFFYLDIACGRLDSGLAGDDAQEVSIMFADGIDDDLAPVVLDRGGCKKI